MKPESQPSPATSITAAVDRLEKAVQAQTAKSAQSAVSTQDKYRATLAVVTQPITDTLAWWKSADNPAKLQTYERLSSIIPDSLPVARTLGKYAYTLGEFSSTLRRMESYPSRVLDLITKIGSASSPDDHQEIKDLLQYGVDYPQGFKQAWYQLETEAVALSSRAEMELKERGIAPPSLPSPLTAMVTAPAHPPVVKFTGWAEIEKS